jgi:hypothetical protein
MKYDMNPVIAPTIAIPLLAATDPVNRNPIRVIEKNPAICQVKDFVKMRVLLSIAASY